MRERPYRFFSQRNITHIYLNPSFILTDVISIASIVIAKGNVPIHRRNPEVAPSTQGKGEILAPIAIVSAFNFERREATESISIYPESECEYILICG